MGAAMTTMQIQASTGEWMEITVERGTSTWQRRWWKGREMRDRARSLTLRYKGVPPDEDEIRNTPNLIYHINRVSEDRIRRELLEGFTFASMVRVEHVCGWVGLEPSRGKAEEAAIEHRRQAHRQTYEVRLPTTERMKASIPDLTGEMSTEEYIRSIRE